MSRNFYVPTCVKLRSQIKWRQSCVHIKGEFVKPETLFKLDKGNLCKKKGLFPAADKSSVKSVREGKVCQIILSEISF